jgi:curved DNA-binding protein CbpA
VITGGFEDICKARRLLGLGEAASLREITESYRRMAHRSHPDTAGDDCENDENMRELNWAYEVLSEFCAAYTYAFRREDFERTYPEERLRQRYVDSWVEGP